VQDHNNNQSNRKSGMSLTELIVSTTILTLVVAGVTSSAILFASIATDHENRSDFTSDIRSGIEQMSFDVRNASGVDLRKQRRFDLSFPSGGSVTYHWQKNNERVVRKENGNTEVIFSNVADFDVLVSEGDEPSNGALSYADDEISIEEMTFKSSKGKTGDSGFTIVNFTFKIRNG